MDGIKLDKKIILQDVIRKLEQEIDITTRAAHAAHEAATHEELVAENKYDTKGLEASYLAGAQARRSLELKKDLALLTALNLKNFSDKDPIAFGALVTLESDEAGAKKLFILPCQGGVEISSKEGLIYCVTQDSPMGKALIGKKQNDEIDIMIKSKKTYFEIIKVL